MKHHDKSKKIKVSSAAILLGALRLNIIPRRVFKIFEFNKIFGDIFFSPGLQYEYNDTTVKKY